MTHDEIKAIIEEAIEAKMAQYWIDRERHYREHDFISRMMDWSSTIGNSVIRAIATTIVAAIVGLIVLGFILWGRNNF